VAYATYTYRQLRSAIEPHTRVDTIEGESSGVVLTERGARLLGLFPRLDLPNVLWVHEEAPAKFAAGEWMVGGERMWLAPERSFYYDNPRDFEGFHVPSDIDPGNYRARGDCEYESHFTLLDLSGNMVYDSAVARRSFAAIPDPYGTGLDYAGVEIEDSVRVIGGSPVF